jgi:hypothetical protein
MKSASTINGNGFAIFSPSSLRRGTVVSLPNVFLKKKWRKPWILCGCRKIHGLLQFIPEEKWLPGDKVISEFARAAAGHVMINVLLVQTCAFQ